MNSNERKPGPSRPGQSRTAEKAGAPRRTLTLPAKSANRNAASAPTPTSSPTPSRTPPPSPSHSPSHSLPQSPQLKPSTHVDPAEGVRVSKRMSELGMASRREADEWIERGWVRVDGELAILGQRVTPEQKITVDKRAQDEQSRRVTVLLNKPIGFVSGQAEDGYRPAVVLVTPDAQWQPEGTRGPARFNRKDMFGLAPAGRLDIDSTGLLVLTQDGRIAKQLIGEDSDVEKEYLVRVRYTGPGKLPAADMQLLNHGLELDGKALRPAKVSWQNEDQLRFVLREGKKRQIRRMCELVGLEVLGLKRIRIGRVPLGELPMGQWRFLGPDESFV